jgi:small subunit ribosomal protein S7
MPRRAVNNRREILPDPKFGNVMIERFANHLMKGGKKTLARSIVYDSFDIISETTKQDPLSIFDGAIRNVSPVLEVRAKRVGGANYQIAMEVRAERRLTLAMRWLIQATRDRNGIKFSEKLAAELLDAAKKEGGAIKKRDEVHRMAEANKAFSHFNF